MKLGIIGEADENSFIRAKQKSLECIEYCLHPTEGIEQYNEKIKKIKNSKQYIQKYGISISSIGSWGSDKITKDGVIKGEVDMAKELIDVAKEVDCPVVVVGCNYVDELSYYENVVFAIKYLEQILSYAKEKGIKLATYNCRWNNFIADDKAWSLIHGYLKELGIKYDPSHSVYAGEDYLLELKNWGDRVYHFHLKGAVVINGDRFDDPPVGMDGINWREIMAVLYAKKYDAVLSLEPHSANWYGEIGEKGVDFSIEYIKPFMF